MPVRHVFELLQREQTRSPDHSLWKLALHLRQARTFGVSQDKLSPSGSIDRVFVMEHSFILSN